MKNTRRIERSKCNFSQVLNFTGSTCMIEGLAEWASVIFIAESKPPFPCTFTNSAHTGKSLSIYHFHLKYINRWNWNELICLGLSLSYPPFPTLETPSLTQWTCFSVYIGFSSQVTKHFPYMLALCSSLKHCMDEQGSSIQCIGQRASSTLPLAFHVILRKSL